MALRSGQRPSGSESDDVAVRVRGLQGVPALLPPTTPSFALHPSHPLRFPTPLPQPRRGSGVGKLGVDQISDGVVGAELRRKASEEEEAEQEKR